MSPQQLFEGLVGMLVIHGQTECFGLIQTAADVYDKALEGYFHLLVSSGHCTGDATLNQNLQRCHLENTATSQN